MGLLTCYSVKDIINGIAPTQDSLYLCCKYIHSSTLAKMTCFYYNINVYDIYRELVNVWAVNYIPIFKRLKG